MSRRVLVTGGAGSIASAFAAAHTDDYELILLDLPGRFSDAHRALGCIVEADLSDLDTLAGRFKGVDTVLHFGGQRSPSALWTDLLPANIVGTYNVVAAAVAARCRRVVYASSVHAVNAHAPHTQVRESDPVMPGDLYGVTKCFGEALGAYAAAAEGVSFVALRIGAFQPPERLSEPAPGWMMRDYCSPSDLVALIRTVIEAGPLRFEIFNAVSRNKFGRLPMEKARAMLGYTPQHDSFELVAASRDAAVALGGLEDQPTLSGMREDVLRLRRA